MDTTNKSGAIFVTDEFRSSRTNLLWLSSIGSILAIHSLQSNKNVNVPGTGISIENWQASIVFIISILFFLYFHYSEFRTIKLYNSSLFRDGESSYRARFENIFGQLSAGARNIINNNLVSNSPISVEIEQILDKNLKEIVDSFYKFVRNLRPMNDFQSKELGFDDLRDLTLKIEEPDSKMNPFIPLTHARSDQPSCPI